MISIVKQFERLNRDVWLWVALRFFHNTAVTLPLSPARTASIKKILIVRNDKIGDMLVTTALFKLLRDKLPHCAIGVLAGPHNAMLARTIPEVDDVYAPGRSLWSLIVTIRRIRRKQYDCCINLVFNKSTLNGLLVNLAMPHGIKFSRAHPRYNFFSNCTTQLHLANIQMTDLVCSMAAELFGFEYNAQTYLPYINIPTDARAAVASKLTTLGFNRPFILLNVSSGQIKNEVQPQLFIALCQELRVRTISVPILILAMPTDVAKAEQIKTQSTLVDCAIYPATTELFEVAAVVDRSLFVITPDTSIAHFAAACKKGVVGMYAGPEEFPMHWRPYGVPFAGVRARKDCGINSLNATEIADAVQSVFAQVATPS